MVTMLLKKRMPLAALIGFLPTSLLFSAAANRSTANKSDLFKLMIPHGSSFSATIKNMRRLVDSDPEILNKENRSGETPLTFALKSGSLFTKFLIKASDPNISNRQNELPLFIAINRNMGPEVTALMKNGANPKRKLPFGETTIEEYGSTSACGDILKRNKIAQEAAANKYVQEKLLPPIQDALDKTSLGTGERHIITIIAEYAAPKSD